MPELKLSPNVGSDRSWVYTVSVDISEGEPEALTLAIRFANSESESLKAALTLEDISNNVFVDANLFKKKFSEAQDLNSAAFGKK
jgi:Ran-binding protein 1